MNRRRAAILRAMLSVPTAPFREEAVAAVVGDWAAGRGLSVERDRAGNLFLRHRRGARRGRRWFFTAHMDHPGFVAVRRRGRTLLAEFRGSVRDEYFAGSRVVFFASRGPVRGTIEAAARVKDSPWLTCRVELAERIEVATGTIGMWDLPSVRIAGTRLVSRACDDVVGAAAVVRAMDEIISRRVEADVTAMLTRAEEAAFIGALAACAEGSVPRDALVVSVECSKAQPRARLGGGVVVRVGDRMRTFDPTLTAHVSAVAERLAGRDKDFRFTRQLMPGGTCESTAFALWGYRAAALCLPMENYHNMGEGGRIAPERIDTRDFDSLVALLVAIAADRRDPREADRALKKRLSALLRERGRLLEGER
jgi:putative aminopeptidase FrvX